ncbi:uncharacterized protein LOC108221733 [Daucus carota subsp. sativus]|uniref:uncharacterized protein LOC108221733 n=1 Tax=Daucus carota subsp. sativus TaxID=79200 RepID=UPI003082936C
MENGRKRIPLGEVSPSSVRPSQMRNGDDHRPHGIPRTHESQASSNHNFWLWPCWFSRHARDSKSNRNYTEGVHRFKPGIGYF